MTTKSTSNGRAAKVLGHMRQFVIDGHIAGAVLRDLGLDYTGDGLAFGEYADGVHGLLVEARLAEGFGSDAADKKISNFVDASYGAGNWKPRKPHLWERGGGDERLDQLFQDQDAAIEEMERLKAAFWTAQDDMRAANQQSDVSPVVARALTDKLKGATTAWEESMKHTSQARAKVTTRQLYLQENFRRRQAGKGK